MARDAATERAMGPTEQWGSEQCMSIPQAQSDMLSWVLPWGSYMEFAREQDETLRLCVEALEAMVELHISETVWPTPRQREVWPQARSALARAKGQTP